MYRMQSWVIMTEAENHLKSDVCSNQIYSIITIKALSSWPRPQTSHDRYLVSEQFSVTVSFHRVLPSSLGSALSTFKTDARKPRCRNEVANAFKWESMFQEWRNVLLSSDINGLELTLFPNSDDDRDLHPWLRLYSYILSNSWMLQSEVVISFL